MNYMYLYIYIYIYVCYRFIKINHGGMQKVWRPFGPAFGLPLLGPPFGPSLWATPWGLRPLVTARNLHNLAVSLNSNFCDLCLFFITLILIFRCFSINSNEMHITNRIYSSRSIDTCNRNLEQTPKAFFLNNFSISRKHVFCFCKSLMVFRDIVQKYRYHRSVRIKYLNIREV